MKLFPAIRSIFFRAKKARKKDAAAIRAKTSLTNDAFIQNHKLQSYNPNPGLGNNRILSGIIQGSTIERKKPAAIEQHEIRVTPTRFSQCPQIVAGSRIQ